MSDPREEQASQAAVDEAYKAPWRKITELRGELVYVCASEFSSDRDVGLNWGPEHVFAVRFRDGSEFEMNREELEHWSGVAADDYSGPQEEFPGDWDAT